MHSQSIQKRRRNLVFFIRVLRVPELVGIDCRVKCVVQLIFGNKALFPQNQNDGFKQ